MPLTVDGSRASLFAQFMHASNQSIDTPPHAHYLLLTLTLTLLLLLDRASSFQEGLHQLPIARSRCAVDRALTHSRTLNDQSISRCLQLDACRTRIRFDVVPCAARRCCELDCEPGALHPAGQRDAGGIGRADGDDDG
jgi:hypothetical protein